MPRIEPKSSALSEPFWEATKSRRLLVQRCDDCQAPVWYPRLRCPGCLSEHLTWVESSGVGAVYTFNVMHKPGNPMTADEAPYVIALVDLDDGYRMLTNISGCAPDSVWCGQRVEVCWDVALSDGRHLPTFQPVD